MLDLLSLLGEGVVWAIWNHRGVLAEYFFGGLAAATAFFFLCSWFARLWNRQLQLSRTHYFWCAATGAMTVTLAIVLAGVMNLSEVAERRVDAWVQSLASDPAGNALWAAQGHALQDAGYAQPKFRPDGGQLLLPDARSYEVSARAMADAALAIFAEQNPTLHSLLGAQSANVVAAVAADADEFFKTEQGDLPEERSIKVLQGAIEAEFAKRIPSLQLWAVIVTVLLAVFA